MKNNLDGLRILIPTRGRTGQQTTLRSLPPVLQRMTTLVAHSEEVAALRHNYAELGMDVVAQSAPISNIAEKRAWMMRWAAPRYERVIMLDDDCYFFARCPVVDRAWLEDKSYWLPNPGKKLLSVAYATPKKLESAFAELNTLLRERGHAGLCSRNGNHVEKREVATTARMMHAIGYDTAVFAKKVKTKNRVLVREDFDYTLQLLRAGYDNAVIFHTCVSPGSYGAKGGCSDERTVELSNREAQKLADLHPGLVRVVQKEYNNVPRQEVVVSWRKALNHG